MEATLDTPTFPRGSTAARWSGRVLTGFPVAFMLFDATIKFAHIPEVAEASLKLGWPTHLNPVLGVIILGCLAIYLWPRTATEEIARAFLTTEPTIAQRVVRAKRALGEAKLGFEVPRGPELLARLPSVLEVLYLVFHEGHTATVGVELIRPDLTSEALRLAALLSELLPGEPEAHALLALMRLHASRAPSRVDDRGDPVLLEAQDRTRWDAGLIAAGLDALARAETARRGPRRVPACGEPHPERPATGTARGSGRRMCPPGRSRPVNAGGPGLRSVTRRARPPSSRFATCPEPDRRAIRSVGGA